jgi:hypothetical protein
MPSGIAVRTGILLLPVLLLFNRLYAESRLVVREVIWELQFFYNSILNILIALLELIKHI